MKLRVSIDMQALAVWHVDLLPYKQQRCEMGVDEFCRAIRAARVTLNLLSADRELRSLFERKFEEHQRARASLQEGASL
ncbi:hypothetical protein [Methylocystis sp.]|uniref:hypothetical protein n=1 Tax=Methylocystis sp. TaxID=1911079 RepID=UPI003D0FCED4